jgi:hypothetical protein
VREHRSSATLKFLLYLRELPLQCVALGLRLRQFCPQRTNESISFLAQTTEHNTFGSDLFKLSLDALSLVLKQYSL